MSPFWPEEKSNQEPLWSLTKNEGVLSCLKGESPFNSRPARFSATLRATTWLTGSRARISSSRDGGKRMGLRNQLGRRRTPYVIRVRFRCIALPQRLSPRFPQERLRSSVSGDATQSVLPASRRASAPRRQPR